MESETIWIIGGGKFGRDAAVKLGQKTPHAKIIMVDSRRLDRAPENVTFVHADGIAWLAENFTPESKVTKIIPAVPLHLAVYWLHKVFPKKDLEGRPFELPDELLAKLPHPIRQSPSRAVISHADFICPEGCNEPERICTYTGKARPASLFKLIGNVDYPPFTPLVLRSRQFAPGVGGFLAEDLWRLVAQVEAIGPAHLLIGTACKCHGIVDGLKISPR
ncbi:MAG: hypothetical protein QNJ17_05210 [Desulfocapsaceae bacterium]|nr:hypothetical protein [Desulfocapsaceae bacterium]